MKIDPFRKYIESKVAKTHSYYESLRPVVEDLVIRQRLNKREVMAYLNQHDITTVQGAQWKYAQLYKLLDYLGLRVDPRRGPYGK